MVSALSRLHSRCIAPYIVYRGTRLYDTWCPKNAVAGTRYNTTDSGWVEEHVFYDWLVNQFIPSVENIKRPLLLIFDGHAAHISTRIIQAAMKHQIELECLPPHTTTILQPLDVVTLTKVKTAWRKLLNEHNMKTNSAAIDRPKFALLVSDSAFTDSFPSDSFLDYRSMATLSLEVALPEWVRQSWHLSVRSEGYLSRETSNNTRCCFYSIFYL
jgi:hypothetical protein